MFQQAYTAYRSGQLLEAADLCDRILRLSPDQQQAIELRAILYLLQKNYQAAKELFYRLLKIDRRHTNAYLNLGVCLRFLGETEKAINIYTTGLTVSPAEAKLYFNRSNCLIELKKYDEAISGYNTAIELKPDYEEAYLNVAAALLETNRFEEAKKNLAKVISLNPNYHEAHYSLGKVHHKLRKFESAINCFQKAIAIKGDHHEAYNDRGLALYELEQFVESLASYDTAIALKSDFAEAYYNRGNTLKNIKRIDEALASYDKAIELKSDFTEAFVNRGNGLSELKRFDEAVASYDKAILFKPDYAEAYSNRGNALNELRRFDEALASYDKAILLKPDYAEAYSNRGNALNELRRFDEALASYDKAIVLKSDFANAYSNRGKALSKLKRLDEAFASYADAIALKPDADFVLGEYFHAARSLCAWDISSGISENIISRIHNEEDVCSPFICLIGFDDADIQMRSSRILSKAYKSYESKNIKNAYMTSDKIRVGYFSSDLETTHPMSKCIRQILKNHDHDKFEIYGFTFGPYSPMNLDQKIIESLDHHYDINQLPVHAVVDLAHKLGINIAVDLNGHTEYSRTELFANRVAPIQVNFLGYPGTSGCDFMDYIVADQVVIPESNRGYFSEKIAYLPHSYFPYGTDNQISEKESTRNEYGIPNGAFVFACFNKAEKIDARMFSLWMKILESVKESVLWLLSENSTVVKNLKREAEKRGIRENRLIFASGVSGPEHLARHKFADLFLDTLPYNAHTTACDALWAGLPLLTLIGNSFTGRVAASILNAARLPELIAKSEDEYISLAVSLANDAGRLSKLKEHLFQNRISTPLFDNARFVKNLEIAYMEMHKTMISGRAPSHVFVSE